MERIFEPWIGANYQTNSAHNCRILILGESHYGKPTDARLDFTNYIVGRYAITERRRFFTVVQRLVSLDTKRGSYSVASKRAFWNSVAFCNYVQAIVGLKARNRPTPAMWDTGARVLLQVLKEAQPEVVVVLGLELKKYLPALPAGVEFAYIKHPSGRGMKYSDCQPPIRAAIERAIAARSVIEKPEPSSDKGDLCDDNS
ncbi:hypothetical protein [Pseudomonas fluorescens]|uniref:Uracil-DNA glycosylase-like domain-containing protein n=1 Tax=Pseudomonas fluorescens TaxID=294 RepID=A0A5E7ETI4_PSEFL|nr:hypothetical protein [Pseudomonas fluorescens]VVO30196.1 hypothetical protein PS723_04927 [Pseudomonas fluorescens]